MNGKCARCHKTVYQVEELKCLDKIWHKGCFRCTVCGMALTLKNYKGYNRMPYCSAHAPKVTATSVASTPEMKRLTNNTRLQSNVKYHEEYEREKNIHTQGKNDETSSFKSKQNGKMESNVAYQVCKMEHKNIVENRKRQLDNISRQSSSNRSTLNRPSSSRTRPFAVNLYEGKTRRNLLSSTSGFSKATNDKNMSNSSIEEVKLSFKSTTFDENLTNSSNSFNSLASVETVTKQTKKPQKRLIAGNGPQTGFDDLFIRKRSDKEIHSAASVKEPINRVKSDRNLKPEIAANGSSVTLTRKTSKVLSQTSNSEHDETLEEVIKFQHSNSKTDIAEMKSKVEPQEQPSTSVGNTMTGVVEREPKRYGIRMYRALFDFHAKEIDEATFHEDDIIIEVEKERYGWITGRVERTGKIGLIPANYLERLKSESQMKLERKLSQVEKNKFNSQLQENSDESDGPSGFREVLIN